MFDIKKIEEIILEFWDKEKIFEKSLEQTRSKPRFVFFEGPPSANGTPGIHHFIGRAFKDIIARYKTMKGFFVLRKAGWDTHGLPIEVQVEKDLGIKNKKEIEKYGVAEFNKKARESVWQYKSDWEHFTRRIGYWLDLKDPYITYDKNYVESLWWIIKKIDKKGYLYEGHKVLPWCPRCGTALSSHEVAQGYENVTEDSVYIKFKLEAGQKLGRGETNSNSHILAWTTTPWTLPGNVALAVGEDIDYVLVQRDEEMLIIAKDLAEKVVGTKEGHVMKGRDLLGLRYEPLFNVPPLNKKESYKIYPADFVTTQDGTGVVHTAVMYGEDDYKLGEELKLPKHHTVTPEGFFTKDVPGFEGLGVKEKETENKIIDHLASINALFKVEPYTHDYPFCWRCHTPLLYYARDSWFVAMSKLRDELVKNNEKINWVPEHLKEGRFGEFLREVKDWAFSRERFWGTPLPIWQCDECKEKKVVGSYQEIHENAYRKPNSYYYMRHGDSEKNDPAIVNSDIAFDKYHLTENGRKQVKKEAKAAAKENIEIIISSPFIRTKETAEIVAKELGLQVHHDDRLYEIRSGQEWEGKPLESYMSMRVKADMDFKFGKTGESWNDVRRRMADLLKDLDAKHEGRGILLVGHGDPLALLEAISEQETGEEAISALLPKDPKNYEGYPQRGKLKKLNYRYAPYDELGNVNPHRPYVDEIFLRCEKCSGKMKRVKELADVWFDSGAMPFAQWHYPFENKNMVENGLFRKARQFPADYISEGIDQTRGWFYTLLAVSTLMGKGAPYKNVISYSHVLDEKGKKMSKSVGNVVDPWDVIKEFGVDASRWYFYTVNTPGDPKLFKMADVGQRLFGFLTTLHNCLRFFELYDKQIDWDTVSVEAESILDEWLLSRLNGVTVAASKSLEEFDITKASRAIEEFVVNDLSNWWVRRSRARFQKPENEKSFERILTFYRSILIHVSKLLAPFAPFSAEEMYHKVHGRKQSVHLEEWPDADKNRVSDELEKEMFLARMTVAKGLAMRKEKSVRVRQPLASITIGHDFDDEIKSLIRDELNVKEVKYDASLKDEVVLDDKLTAQLKKEGYVREVMRKIQDMRKEAGYKIDDRVSAVWHTDDEELKSAVQESEKEISHDVLLEHFEMHPNQERAVDIEGEYDLAPGKKIYLAVWK